MTGSFRQRLATTQSARRSRAYPPRLTKPGLIVKKPFGYRTYETRTLSRGPATSLPAEASEPGHEAGCLDRLGRGDLYVVGGVARCHVKLPDLGSGRHRRVDWRRL